MRHLVVALGAVEVGKCLPPTRHDPELLEGELFGVAEQERCRRRELITDTWMGGQAGELVALSPTDVSREECVTDAGHGAADRCQPAEPGGVAGRAVDLGADPLTDRTMAVDRVDAAAFALAEQRRHLGIRPSTDEFELPEPFGERRVGEVDRIGEQLLEHGSRITNSVRSATISSITCSSNRIEFPGRRRRDRPD